MTDSISYYNGNADDFFERTSEVNIGSLYDLFIPRVPAGGKILDAGCGSGRDAKHFVRGGPLQSFSPRNV